MVSCLQFFLKVNCLTLVCRQSQLMCIEHLLVLCSVVLLTVYIDSSDQFDFPLGNSCLLQLITCISFFFGIISIHKNKVYANYAITNPLRIGGSNPPVEQEVQWTNHAIK